MKKVKTPYEVAVDNFFSAAAGVRRAQTNFDNALPEFFEIANEELSIAIAHLSACEKKVKALNMPS